MIRIDAVLHIQRLNSLSKIVFVQGSFICRLRPTLSLREFKSRPLAAQEGVLTTRLRVSLLKGHPLTPLLKLCHTAEEKLWIQGSQSKWELYMLVSSMIRALVWKGWIFLTCASSAALVTIPSTSNVSVKMNIALTLVFVQEFGAGNAACPEHSWGWAFHKRQAERRLLDITSRKANLNMHMGTEEWAYSGEPWLKAVIKLLTSISACSSLSFFSPSSHSWAKVRME